MSAKRQRTLVEGAAPLSAPSPFLTGTMLVHINVNQNDNQLIFCRGSHKFLSALEDLICKIDENIELGDLFIDVAELFFLSDKKPESDEWWKWTHPLHPGSDNARALQDSLKDFQKLLGQERFITDIVEEDWFIEKKQFSLPFNGCVRGISIDYSIFLNYIC